MSVPVAALPELPGEAWCGALSFVLRGSRAALPVSCVSCRFRELVREPLSWDGVAACIDPQDLGSAALERLVPAWRLCSHATVDFTDAHVGARRLAAKRCFAQLVRCCTTILSLRVRNWCYFERSGLDLLRAGLPRLRHLELSACDHISSYDTLVPLFSEHPRLLSLRATFHPKAAAGAPFCEALPRTLAVLGFVRFERPEGVTTVFGRCSLEHLWLAATGRDWFSPRMAEALRASGGGLTTLSLPSEVSEELCAHIAEGCPRLELLCRMRVGPVPFGAGALSSAFEPLDGSQGTVARRRGSTAELAHNGALWAPRTEDLQGEPARRAARPRGPPEAGAPGRKPPQLPQQSAAALRDQRWRAGMIARQAAAAVASRRGGRDRGAQPAGA